MQFFKTVIEPRFPRSTIEGGLKGFLLGAVFLCLFQEFSTKPNTEADQEFQSRIMMAGYIFFILAGAFCGSLGQNRDIQEAFRF